MGAAREATQRMTTVNKAVIPAAGWGTRLLPATKAIPKEMVTVLDRPAIQWAVEEAVGAGLDDLCIVTSRSKSAIEDHFDAAPELEAALESRNKLEVLQAVRRTATLARIHYTRQASALGLGHAIAQAAQHVGGDPFAVLLPDVVMDPGSPTLAELVGAHGRTGASVLALIEVPEEQVSLYGCVAVEAVEGDDTLVRIVGVVEKPAPSEAPSNLTVVGRYVLTRSVMDALETTAPSAGGEIQLTDAIASVIEGGEPVYGLTVDSGVVHDTGSVLGLLEANLAFGLADSEIGPPLRRLLEQRGVRD